MRRLLFSSFSAAAAFAFAQPVIAQSSYPDKPIRFIVAYPPGGGTDFMARLVADGLSDQLGKPVLVDNRDGGGGVIGTVLAARAPSDGYTLLLATGSTFAVNPHTKKNLPYDPVRDFSPIALLAIQPYALVVHPALPVRSVPELVAFAKSKPGILNYGSSGIGGSAHLTGALLNSVASIAAVHVPYKGNGPAMTALIGGQVSFMFPTIPSVGQHVASGRLRALATTGAKRSLAFPELPTMVESGFHEFLAGTWYGMVAPAKTPRAILAKLNQGLLKVIALPGINKRLTVDEGAEVAETSPDEFAKFIRDDITRFGKIVATVGFRLEEW